MASVLAFAYAKQNETTEICSAVTDYASEVVA